MARRDFAPGAISYSGPMSEGYATGRKLPPAAADTWRSVISRWLEPLSPRVIADIGAGTGRFSALIAETLRVRVIALEPAAEMRANAVPHPRVDQVAADAQALPLAVGSCDATWMAYVIHHVPDVTAAVQEVARVLRPGGRFLLIGGFPDLLGDLTLFRFWPEARRITDRFPRSTALIPAFTGAGLTFENAEPVTLRTADSLAEAAARTRLRADTTLSLLGDEEFERGQAAIEAAARSEHGPVDDTVHMLVFQR